MKSSTRGSQRMVIRLKHKPEASRKAIPKKVFLGIRYKRNPQAHGGCFGGDGGK